jgi:diadenosine tetraphosphate (Ap4A) HIT family hydrolase
MTSVFSRIIAGEIPASFVHRDDLCVSFMTINPIAPGHLLVVPREEVDHWIDLAPDVSAHLFRLCHRISRALTEVFPCDRIGLVVAGYEVPHCHVHLVPTRSMADIDFSRAAGSVDRAELDRHAAAVAAALSSGS